MSQEERSAGKEREPSAANPEPFGCLEMADLVRINTLAQQHGYALSPSFNATLQEIWKTLAISPILTIQDLKSNFPNWSPTLGILENLSDPPVELHQVALDQCENANLPSALVEFAVACTANEFCLESYNEKFTDLANRFQANITLILPSLVTQFTSEFAQLEILMSADVHRGWCFVIPPAEHQTTPPAVACYFCANAKYHDLELIICRGEGCDRRYHHLCAIADGSEAQGRCGPCARDTKFPNVTNNLVDSAPQLCRFGDQCNLSGQRVRLCSCSVCGEAFHLLCAEQLGSSVSDTNCGCRSEANSHQEQRLSPLTEPQKPQVQSDLQIPKAQDIPVRAIEKFPVGSEVVFIHDTKHAAIVIGQSGDDHEVSLREPDRDGRFDFSGGRVQATPAQIQRPEKCLLLAGRGEKYWGFGLPGLMFGDTSVQVAEFAKIKVSAHVTQELGRGQAFKEKSDQSLIFFFCGLARPKGSDVYLYFLADKEKNFRGNSVPSSSKFIKVNIINFCDSQKSETFLESPRDSSTKFIQTLLNKFYAEDPEGIATKNTTKQRLVIFETQVAVPAVEKRKTAPPETKVHKDKRRRVAVVKGKKMVQDESEDEPVPVPVPSTRSSQPADLSATITRCIQTSMQALKSELKAELRLEMKQDSKSTLQMAQESSKQFQALAAKLQQEMVQLLKARDEKIETQLQALTEIRAADIKEDQLKPKKPKKTRSRPKVDSPKSEEPCSTPPEEVPISTTHHDAKDGDKAAVDLEKIVQLQEKLLQQVPPQVPQAQPQSSYPYQPYPQHVQMASPFTHFGMPQQLMPPAPQLLQPSFLAMPHNYPAFLPADGMARMVASEAKPSPNVQALLTALQKSIYQ